MNLTFTRSGASWAGRLDSGLRVFHVARGLTRGTSVYIDTTLPGFKSRIEVLAPEGAKQYGMDAENAAFAKCARMLERWALKHLGVETTVDVIVNT